MPPRRPRILVSFFWHVDDLQRGVLRYCRQHGWDAVSDAAAARRAEDEPVDGVIGMLPPDHEHPTRKRVAALGVPVVEMSRAYPENTAWRRYPEECEKAGRIAAGHLRLRPVKSFAFFDDTPWWNHDARFEGFRAALKDDPRPLRRFHFRQQDMRTWNPLADYLSELPKPCGVFGATDLCARTVINAALEAGYAVPGDFYVMGCGDWDMHTAGPGVELTSIPIDREAWAYAAAGLLDEAMSGKAPPGTCREFPVGALVVRPSTGGETGGDPLCGRALALMRANLTEPLTVVRLAKQLGVSPSSLERAFAAHLGTGVGRRYQELRLDAAKGLLAAGEKAEYVATAVGYASYRAFLEAFRKSTGTSPGRVSRNGRRAGGTGR